jgi:hypothetical protein
MTRLGIEPKRTQINLAAKCPCATAALFPLPKTVIYSPAASAQLSMNFCMLDKLPSQVVLCSTWNTAKHENISVLYLISWFCESCSINYTKFGIELGKIFL